MPAGSYLLMLNEIPIVMGTVSLEKHFCDATVEQLRKIGITAEEARNPEDDSKGTFIATEDVDVAEAHRFRTWGPGEYVALHLDSLLRKNLTLFLGTNDIATELDAPDAEGLLDQLRSARGGLARFRTVTLALLYEELPAQPLPVLARRYLELVNHPAYDIAEECRLLGPVNQHLVRDAVAWRVFALSDVILDLIERHIVRDADAAFLALEPEDTQEALSAVRDAMGNYDSHGRISVILVEDWRSRPFIRKLVELEFPQLWVVAKREVDEIDPALLEPVAVISLA
jgi:flagellar biosynthesis component FlhA